MIKRFLCLVVVFAFCLGLYTLAYVVFNLCMDLYKKWGDKFEKK